MAKQVIMEREDGEQARTAKGFSWTTLFGPFPAEVVPLFETAG